MILTKINDGDHGMKRSQINSLILEADKLIRSFGFSLPPFAYWSPNDFKNKSQKVPHVVGSRCGWDITDFGFGRYDDMGLFLFTLRNGPHDLFSKMDMTLKFIFHLGVPGNAFIK